MSEVATRQEPAQDVAVQRQSDNLLAQIIEAAKNPEVDAAKMVAMANLATSLQDRERQTQFAQDFAAALMEMPRISKQNRIIIPAKDGKPAREQGRFASFENIDAMVRPILARHNMVLSFRLGSDQGTTCRTVLTHTNGHVEIGDSLRVPPDTSGSKNAAQAVGSSAQYAKRYAMCATLNIVTEGEDRDGTSYPLATDELNDRQQRIVQEAYASHADGNYQAWWDKQTAKDREMLIIRGVHAELTGAPKLPGPRTVDEATNEAVRDEGELVDDSGDQGRGAPPTPEPKQGSGRTAAQMVDDYIARVDACENTDSLLVIQEDPKTIRWLGQLNAKDTAQYQRATVASSRRYAELLAKEEEADGGRLV